MMLALQEEKPKSAIIFTRIMADAVIVMSEKATTTSVVVGTLAGVFGLFSLQEWLAVLSAVAVVGTFLVNWYYRYQELKLKRQQLRDEHETAYNQPTKH